MSTAASQPASDPVRLLVVMGVAGCGKSTVAESLAGSVGGAYLDGDAFHPASSIAKMSAGTPLTDEDRWPWLDIVGEKLAAQPGRAVVACSALRRAYRDRLRAAAGERMLFIHLAGSRELIARRMEARKGHFMPPGLLKSQFATLEAPGPDEAITVDIDAPPEVVLDRILAGLERRLI